MPRILLFLAMIFCSWGCSSLMFWKDDEEPVVPSDSNSETPAKGDTSGKKAAVSSLEEQELKLAKLWARVDELEENQLRQKEQIRVLEKGFTYGLIPEEMKDAKEKGAKVVPEAPKVPEANTEAPKDKSEKNEPTGSPTLAGEELESYQKQLATASAHYRAGRYGQAIVEYSQIGKTFGEKVPGAMHLFWIAKSWSELKEYNTARQHLVDFLSEQPTSPWIPRAKLELARVEWRLGLQETALQRFREIVKEYPYEDAAELAKVELQNLDKSL